MIVVGIENMTCAGCVTSVRNALTRAGLAPSEVTVGQARLDISAEDSESVAKARAAIEKAGFAVAAINSAE